MGTKIRYVLLKLLKPERDLCSLLTTRILFNRFSHCEVYLFLFTFKHYHYLREKIITFFIRITFIYPNFMWLPFGIVLWYPSLTDDNTILNICRGHHLTIVTRGEIMSVFLLTYQRISLVKSTMTGMM